MHARGFSVHHLFRHVTVCISLFIMFTFVQDSSALPLKDDKFFFILMQEHAATVLQYFLGIQEKAALYPLLVTSSIHICGHALFFLHSI